MLSPLRRLSCLDSSGQPACSGILGGSFSLFIPDGNNTAVVHDPWTLSELFYLSSVCHSACCWNLQGASTAPKAHHSPWWLEEQSYSSNLLFPAFDPCAHSLHSSNKPDLSSYWSFHTDVVSFLSLMLQPLLTYSIVSCDCTCSLCHFVSVFYAFSKLFFFFNNQGDAACYLLTSTTKSD